LDAPVGSGPASVEGYVQRLLATDAWMTRQ
jgi:hypothetical protein